MLSGKRTPLTDVSRVIARVERLLRRDGDAETARAEMMASVMHASENAKNWRADSEGRSFINL